MIRTLQNAGPTLKIVLGALLVIICASMAITLIPGGVGGSLGIGAPAAGVLATVGDQQVTMSEVQKQARAMLRQQFPQGGPQLGMLQGYFSQRAAEQLIGQKVMVVEAERLGLKTNDQELRDDLQRGPLSLTFFPDGKFIGQEAYADLIQQHDMTVEQFETAEKDSILIRKLQALVTSSAFVPDSEVHEEFLHRDTKVKFNYAVITQADILKGLHPTDEELKAFYDHNKASYANAVPEKRQIKYAVVEASKIAAATNVSDAELQNYYDEHRDEYRVPEQVKVRHILIKTPLPAAGQKEDEKAVAEARAKAEDVLKQLKAGGDFAKLAEKYSEDTTAKEGGELGWIQRGRTVPEFEKVAFSLPKGQTSDLVKSSYGFHIIQVEDKQDAHLKSLAEVKNEIQEKVKQQKVAAATEKAANALLSAARADGLDKAAAANGTTAVTTDFVGRTEALPGIGGSPQLMDAVFNASEKSMDEVQVPQGYVVYQVVAVKPPATPTFEEIRSRVESEFKNQRAGFLLQQRTQELADRAKADHDLKKVAKELGANYLTSEFVTPDGQVPSIGSLTGPASAIFSLKQGEVSGPIVSGGTGAVAEVIDRQVPTDQEFAAKKDEIRQGLLEEKQNEMFELFVTNLRKDMEKSGKLKINQAEMNALTRQSGTGGGGDEGSE
ncbi:MAG TPA: peptidyl-prolyl cis-trans isomerase [Terriglobales bacterium]|nr:peptidyl-prolyl cis-trans isomerase [Terriglobales bacterium]